MFDVSSGWFDNQACEVERGNEGKPNRIDIFYGGFGVPTGIGHGHVVSNDGENIHFWRLPVADGGRVVIDDSFSFEKLSQHGF